MVSAASDELTALLSLDDLQDRTVTRPGSPLATHLSPTPATHAPWTEPDSSVPMPPASLAVIMTA
eukprot:2082845-Pyramimonas_sp.AAC.1